ncbi:MAG: hypothetical protein LBD29_09900 [Treponema sp.]|jgi:flavodoxin|nr:hypothetical protein [Treponema sp.]
MEKETLIVYYSRSGISERLAKALQHKLGCDMDKIAYADKEQIAFGTAVVEALRKATVPIKGSLHKPEDYKKIIFITPVWGGAMATPIRSYMTENKEHIQSYSLIVTCGKSGLSGSIKDAAAALGKEPVGSEQYLSSQVTKGAYNLERFI